MTRPTPHAVRRVLFGLNLGLLALLVTLGVSTFADYGSTKAEAAPATDELRITWMTGRQTGLRWTPTPPVTPKEADAVFGRYATLRPEHWPFVGPLPPEPEARTAHSHEEPKGPADLASLGAVGMLTVGEGVPVLSFTFHKAPRAMAHVTTGEFIRRSPDAPGRFRLTRIERLSDELHHIHYDVLAGGVVVREAVHVHDTRSSPPTGGPLRVHADASENTEAPPRHEDSAEPAEPPSAPDVMPRAPSVLKPKIHTNPGNPRDRVIELDAPTHRWGKAHGIEALLKQLKTTPAIDTTTGRTLGVRIAGFGQGLKADAFDVRKGDILVSVAGREVLDRADLIAIAKTLDPDKLVPVVIDRRGTKHTYRVDARDPHTKRKLPYFENLK